MDPFSSNNDYRYYNPQTGSGSSNSSVPPSMRTAGYDQNATFAGRDLSSLTQGMANYSLNPGASSLQSVSHLSGPVPADSSQISVAELMTMVTEQKSCFKYCLVPSQSEYLKDKLQIRDMCRKIYFQDIEEIIDFLNNPCVINEEKKQYAFQQLIQELLNSKAEHSQRVQIPSANLSYETLTKDHRRNLLTAFKQYPAKKQQILIYCGGKIQESDLRPAPVFAPESERKLIVLKSKIPPREQRRSVQQSELQNPPRYETPVRRDPIQEPPRQHYSASAMSQWQPMRPATGYSGGYSANVNPGCSYNTPYHRPYAPVTSVSGLSYVAQQAKQPQAEFLSEWKNLHMDKLDIMLIEKLRTVEMINDWKSLGRMLDMTDDELDEIYHNYRKVDEKIHQMYRTYFNSEGGKNFYHKLYEALGEIQMKETQKMLIEYLHEKYS